MILFQSILLGILRQFFQEVFWEFFLEFFHEFFWEFSPKFFRNIFWKFPLEFLLGNHLEILWESFRNPLEKYLDKEE